MVKIIIIFLFGLSYIMAQPMKPQRENPAITPHSHCLRSEQPCEECLCVQDEPPPARPSGPDFEGKKPKEKLEMIRIWKLTEELNLSEDQSTRFFPKLKELKRVREEFEQNRMKIIEEIENYLRNAKKYEKELKAKIQELELSESKFREAEAKIKKEIAAILTPEQQAKFMLFQMRFNEELRNVIQRAKKMKKEMRTKRPWRFW